MAATKPAEDDGEGRRLREEYERARERYMWILREMRIQSQAKRLEGFDKLIEFVREARAQAVDARRALKLFESKRKKK